MMKKIIYQALISLFIIALIITLTACGSTKQATPTPPSSTTTTATLYSSNDKSHDYHIDYDNTSHYDRIESAPITATHIFFAEYTGKYELDNTDIYLYFKPLQQFKGDPINEDVLITKSNTTHLGIDEETTPYTYTAAPHNMREGGTYWIFLEHTSDVYSKYPDHYLLFKQIGDWWPTEYENITDDPYYQENAQRLIDYLTENPSSPKTKGKDFIRSDKIEDIIAQSPTVLHIRVDQRDVNLFEPYYNHKCRVIEVLKGDVTVNSDIDINLRYSDTYISGEYIVMLDENAQNVTSPHSLYSLAERDTVNQIYDVLGFDSPYSSQ